MIKMANIPKPRKVMTNIKKLPLISWFSETIILKVVVAIIAKNKIDKRIIVRIFATSLAFLADSSMSSDSGIRSDLADVLLKNPFRIMNKVNKERDKTKKETVIN